MLAIFFWFLHKNEQSWIWAGHLYLIWGCLGVFRDSSREPVSPVGTYRSASHPDENLRWSMPRSAVSTDVFGCVAALCMGTIWDYDTPWTGIHVQAAVCFISRFSNRFNWHFSDVSKVFCLAESLGTEYAGLGAGFDHVSFEMFHSGVGKTECKPSDTTGLWWYGDMNSVDIMGYFYILLQLLNQHYENWACLKMDATQYCSPSRLFQNGHFCWILGYRSWSFLTIISIPTTMFDGYCVVNCKES